MKKSLKALLILWGLYFGTFLIGTITLTLLKTQDVLVNNFMFYYLCALIILPLVSLFILGESEE